MSNNNEISLEIQSIFDKNRLEDLKRFLNKRQCLNVTNSYLIYLFHFVQSAGILTTSFAAGSNNTNLVWIGISLNCLATLISIYEKTNNSLLKKLMNDIKMIKEGTYVDEGELVDTDNLNTQVNQNINNQNLKYNSSINDNVNNKNDEITSPLLNSNSQSYSTFNGNDPTQKV
jgi:hypothetical protein